MNRIQEIQIIMRTHYDPFILSEDLAIETVQLYENGVLEWTP